MDEFCGWEKASVWLEYRRGIDSHPGQLDFCDVQGKDQQKLSKPWAELHRRPARRPRGARIGKGSPWWGFNRATPWYSLVLVVWFFL